MKQIYTAAIGVAIWGTVVLSASVLQAQEKGHLFAHRGGAYEFEENTMDAFRGSYEKGLRGCEVDIRMSKDGELIVLHDDSLDRTHHGQGPAEHKTAAELKTIKTKKSGQEFLFLDEFLDFFADKPGVYIEFEMKVSNKNLYPDQRVEEYVRKLYAAVKARQPEGSTYVLTSFDERPLRAIKKFAPEADLLLISGGPVNAEMIQRAQDIGINRIGCRMEGTTRAAVREAQKAGLKVTGWPGHNMQDYFLAIGLGVDGICSDIPVQVHQWRQKHEQ